MRVTRDKVLRDTVSVRTHVRWMIRRDLPEVLAIEAAGPGGWAEDRLLRALRYRHCIGMVAELGGRVVGHMVYTLHHDRLYLRRLGVHPEYRRLGIGRQMVEGKLIRKLREGCGPPTRKKLVAVVRERDLPAQLFLAACGLRCTGVAQRHGRPDRYRFAVDVERGG